MYTLENPTDELVYIVIDGVRHEVEPNGETQPLSEYVVNRWLRTHPFLRRRLVSQDEVQEPQENQARELEEELERVVEEELNEQEEDNELNAYVRNLDYRGLQEAAKELELPAGGSHEELLERVLDEIE